MLIKHTKLLLFCTLVILVCSNCSSNSGSNNTETISPTAPPRFLQQNLPHVYKYVETGSQQLKEALNSYTYKIVNANTLINTQKELKHLFAQRENEIIPQLEAQVFEPLLDEDPDALLNEESEYFFNELKEIGIQGTFSEGMYVALGKAPLLETQLQTLADEAFRLYIQFEHAQTEAIGGEYPFLDLEGEIKSVALGEQLLFKYPRTDYARNIESRFRFCLKTLTDIHTLTGQYDKGCLTHALSFEHYPYEISMEQIKQFPVKHPQSRYAKVLANIAENPSEMELDADEPKPVYLVLINRFKPQLQPDESSASAHLCPDAEKELYRYLDNGTDVCHTLLIYDKNEPTCALVYRYYPTAEKAGKALQNWKSKMPDVPAQIVKVRYNTRLERWEIQSS